MAKKPRPTPQPVADIKGLIDAHTHITSCKDSAQDVIRRAWLAGLNSMVTVGDGLEEAQAAHEIASLFDGVYAACAIHPTKATQLDDAAKAQLRELAASEHCVAVGETGLDTYWIKHDPEGTAPLEVQLEALEWHNQLALEVDKPLMIHNREADTELLDALGQMPRAKDVILHCYSSPVEMAKEAIERGYYLSFSGNVTFKRNDYLREVAAMMPIELMLYETDAPYMTPEPFRGARNEPAFIGHTAICLAEQRGMDLSDFLAQLQQNYARVYGVDPAN